MPIHDWTRVGAGIFHDFHHSWIDEIKKALNAGLLPADYYALAEQIVGDLGPDVLTLQTDFPEAEPPSNNSRGTVAVAVAPPKAYFTAQTEMDQYVLKQNTLVIRHSSGDQIVALVEIVSPGNKASRHALRKFVEKAAAALWRGYHLLILDLQPPGPRDPQGIHGAIWEEIADASYRQPGNKPLTLAAYDAGPPKTAYVEPVAVGQALPDMPLFLRPGEYILVPLEATYRAAWQSVPQRWRRVLEPPAG
jgi:Protein of unknown function (DUF4058)